MAAPERGPVPEFDYAPAAARCELSVALRRADPGGLRVATARSVGDRRHHSQPVAGALSARRNRRCCGSPVAAAEIVTPSGWVDPLLDPSAYDAPAWRQLRLFSVLRDWHMLDRNSRWQIADALITLFDELAAARSEPPSSEGALADKLSAGYGIDGRGDRCNRTAGAGHSGIPRVAGLLRPWAIPAGSTRLRSCWPTEVPDA